MNKETIRQRLIQAAQQVREKKPLAPSITNSVTIEFVANAQLAVGGSAAMVYLPDEGEFIARTGSAVYLNVGTLFPVYEQTLPRLAQALQESGTPWVLDPVAIGIGELRTHLLRDLKPYRPSIIRGNASEILVLAGLWELEGFTGSTNTRGVDTADPVAAARQAAVALARHTGGAVAVSGETDLVTDGTTLAWSQGGSPMMERITGCGCSLGGVAAVYAGVTDPFTAALAATNVYNLAGARAEQTSPGPGSFRANFLDQLYLATPEDIADNPFTLETL